MWLDQAAKGLAPADRGCHAESSFWLARICSAHT
jgi:hypothetical protein